MFSLKGIYYNNFFIYNSLTTLKLGFSYYDRFKIAAKYIGEEGLVLDVCSGTGMLKRFLPRDCVYECIDSSLPVSAYLDKKGIKHHCYDLNNGINRDRFRADAVVMLISLYHFRKTVVHELLEDYKKISKNVIIIEDVLKKKRKRNSLLQKIMNFLCGLEYELFTTDEFERILQEHGYTCDRHGNRYIAGYYTR